MCPRLPNVFIGTAAGKRYHFLGRISLRVSLVTASCLMLCVNFPVPGIDIQVVMMSSSCLCDGGLKFHALPLFAARLQSPFFARRGPFAS